MASPAPVFPYPGRGNDVAGIDLDKAGGLTAAPALRTAALGDVDRPLWLAQDRPGGVRDIGSGFHPSASGYGG